MFFIIVFPFAEMSNVNAIQAQYPNSALSSYGLIGIVFSMLARSLSISGLFADEDSVNGECLFSEENPVGSERLFSND